MSFAYSSPTVFPQRMLARRHQEEAGRRCRRRMVVFRHARHAVAGWKTGSIPTRLQSYERDEVDGGKRGRWQRGKATSCTQVA